MCTAGFKGQNCDQGKPQYHLVDQNLQNDPESCKKKIVFQQTQTKHAESTH